MFRLLSGVLVICLLAQVVVTARSFDACAGCDPAVALQGDRDHVDGGNHQDHAVLQSGCCCGSDGAPCPLDCDGCACCPHQRPMALQKSIATPILARFDLEFARPVDLLPQPHADEILHIPKSLRFV